MSHSQHVSPALLQIIAKQLVEALIEVHSRGVFHNDIKPENILIETSSGVPRVRIIDFGCGTFLKEGVYTTAQGRLPFLQSCSLNQSSIFVVSLLYLRPSPLTFFSVCIVGTDLYTSPEWFRRSFYMAKPATVWQLGVLLFVILHRRYPFDSSTEIVKKKTFVSKRFSLGKS